MKEIGTLTIRGRIPSKKNQQQIFRKGKSGVRFITSSESYKEWEKSQIRNLPVNLVYSNICKITMYFWFPDNLRSDLTNKSESIMDMLVKAKVISDDNWKTIPSICLKAEGVDKENPRVEVKFYNVERINQ
ncbi:MAG: hypothetical protein HC875_38225 [Anaerolineales bacterium]|nr:hypothetical protein [Anaerolineales bacterium]